MCRTGGWRSLPGGSPHPTHTALCQCWGAARNECMRMGWDGMGRDAAGAVITALLWGVTTPWACFWFCFFLFISFPRLLFGVARCCCCCCCSPLWGKPFCFCFVFFSFVFFFLFSFSFFPSGDLYVGAMCPRLCDKAFSMCCTHSAVSAPSCPPRAAFGARNKEKSKRKKERKRTGGGG